MGAENSRTNRVDWVQNGIIRRGGRLSQHWPTPPPPQGATPQTPPMVSDTPAEARQSTRWRAMLAAASLYGVSDVSCGVVGDGVGDTGDGVVNGVGYTGHGVVGDGAGHVLVGNDVDGDCIGDVGNGVIGDCVGDDGDGVFEMASVTQATA